MASSSDQNLKVYLGKELKNAWVERCREKGISPQQEVKRMILESMLESHDRAKVLVDMPDTLKKKRVEIRLTSSEYKAIEQRTEGGSVQTWIINSVRASLTNAPHFSMDATKALWSSSRELRAIGRNLNQIAKALNAGEPASLSTEKISALSDVIYDHTRKVSKVVSSGVNRWVIKDE